MSDAILIVKVDPARRTIVRMPIKPSLRGVRKLLGTSQVDARVLLDTVPGSDEMLLLGARVNVHRRHVFKEWRLRGHENTVGVGILFGTLNRKADGMCHCPVSVEWLEKRIVWCEPGEDAPAEEVREAMGLDAPNDPPPLASSYDYPAEGWRDEE
jgi:hypothetical protein